MLSCVIERQNLPGILRTTQFHNLKLGEEYPQCRRQSEDEALASLLQDVPFSQFVPAGMWIIDWEPLGHHVDNYQKVGLWAFHPAVFLDGILAPILYYCDTEYFESI